MPGKQMALAESESQGAPRELILKVTAPAEGGKANEAVVRLIAHELGIPKSAIAIKRGSTSRHKLLVLDIAADTFEKWLLLH